MRAERQENTGVAFEGSWEHITRDTCNSSFSSSQGGNGPEGPMTYPRSLLQLKAKAWVETKSSVLVLGLSQHCPLGAGGSGEIFRSHSEGNREPRKVIEQGAVQL